MWRREGIGRLCKTTSETIKPSLLSSSTFASISTGQSEVSSIRGMATSALFRSKLGCSATLPSTRFAISKTMSTKVSNVPNLPIVQPRRSLASQQTVIYAQQKKRYFTKALLLGTAVYVAYEVMQGEHEKQGGYLNILPTRAMSYLFGLFAEWESPPEFNKAFCKLWAKVFDANLDEMAEPLENYKNFQAFFTRKLKPGVRPIGDGLVSPVDGKVLFVGEMPGKVERIKGITYELPTFLGEKPVLEDQKNKLYECIIYLAPGDYHCIHSPANLVISERNHFPGTLLPVSPWAVMRVLGLFALNERVVLKGKWKHGPFYLTPVGATNVGSIQLAIEPGFETNKREHETGRGENGQPFFSKVYKEKVELAKGSDLGVFRLGSTVVLHFEGPQELEWYIKEGDKVKVGQSIANIEI